MSFAEAEAQVLSDDGFLAVSETDIRGVPTRVFTHAPRVLREIVDSTRMRGDATFLVFEDERWSFAEWARRVDEFAAALVDTYGVTKGDRVAIAMRNYPEWIVAWAAAVSIGAISVSLNAWWGVDELTFALEDCEPRVVVADAERVIRTASVCAEHDIALVGVRLWDPRAPEVSGDIAVDRFEDVLIGGASMPSVDVDTDDDATILYTSGTTGRAKGAVSTHRAVLSALLGYAAKGAIDALRKAADTPAGDDADATAPERVFILIVPLFHVTGSVPVMLGAMTSGLKLVIMYRWDPERALELIEREKVTQFVGVPTQTIDLLQSPRFADFDTSSLTSVSGGGAPTPATVVDEVAHTFGKGAPGIGYGLTETNSYAMQNSGADYLAHPTSTGRPVRILQVETRDPQGNTLPVGETGEIWMKGPNLFRGYWNRPEATAEALVDGWFRSGDIGHVDADGFVYISDRVKDMVLRGGENVYCNEVEDVFYEHPAVREAAVFGIPDERLGESVAAVVRLQDGATATAEQLRAHLAARLAAFKVPDRIDVRHEPLPRNAAGKFLKRTLRDEFVA